MEKFFTPAARFSGTAVFFAAALVFALAACTDPFDPAGAKEREQYTITFDSQKGSAVDSITGDEGTAVPQPNDPTREDFDFQGWYSAASGGTKYEWPYTLTGNVTMYARWALSEKAREAVEGFKQDEAVEEALSQDAGEIDLATEDLAGIKAGVDEALAAYDTLSPGAKEALAAEKAKLDAIHTKIENVNTALDFKSTHGTVLGKTPDEIESLEDAAALLPILEKALEDLSGLSGPVKELLADDVARLEDLKEKAEEVAKANATDEDKKAAESFRSAYADILNKTPATVSVADKDTVDAAFLAYEALGDGVRILLQEEYAKLLALKAEIDILKTSVITFDSQGGSEVEAIRADTGTLVPEPDNPTKSGYVFAGWYSAASGGTKYEWPYTLTGDTTMYARWVLPDLTGTVAVSGAYDISQTGATVPLTLTADTSALGGSGDISYQWQIAAAAAGDFTDISGAAGNTYTLAAPDQGQYIRVRVSRAGHNGTKSSDAVGPVVLPGLTGTVTIGGSHDAANPATTEPLTLTAVTTSLGGTGPISYRWQRSDTATGAFTDISGANRETYMLVDSDQGKYIKVTAGRAGYDGTKSSDAVGPVDIPDLSGTVSVTGTARVRLPLGVNTDSLNGSGEIGYQWERSDAQGGPFTAIPGATGETYTLAKADEDKYIRVTVKRSGYFGSVSSSSTEQVTLQAPGTRDITIGFNYGAISITGSDGSNVIFKASNTPNAVILSAADYTDVQWYVDGAASPAGTGNSITLEASAYSAKAHSLTFTGKKNGKLYSQIIPFTVKN